MGDLAIRVEDLSKLYRIGAAQPRYRTLRESLVDLATAPLRRAASVLRGSTASGASDDLWALKDVSFEVSRGEVVGIIGRNGAGKSTLLKILSRITEPTQGRVGIKGRVGSLLEVGTGFHPELTGRENVYLNGAILGMRRTEIDRKFDEIVAFSELERFLDTPVKHYSSGMYTRLAFAVAAHLEPDVLVVDEVLAVGDAAFQKKCLGKMKDVAKQGRTVLFVSHNMGAIRALCQRVVLFDSGRVAQSGDPERVTESYSGQIDTLLADGPIPERLRLTGDRRLVIERGLPIGCGGNPSSAFLIGEPITIRLWYHVAQPTRGAFWVIISTADGEKLLSCFQKDTLGNVAVEVDGVVEVTLTGAALLPGTYFVSSGFFSAADEPADWVEGFLRFDVLPHFEDGRPFDNRHGRLTTQGQWRLTDG